MSQLQIQLHSPQPIGFARPYYFYGIRILGLGRPRQAIGSIPAWRKVSTSDVITIQADAEHQLLEGKYPIGFPLPLQLQRGLEPHEVEARKQIRQMSIPMIPQKC